MAEKDHNKESEKSEQTVSEEALAQAEKAIRLYSELAELITGVEVDYYSQVGGPEGRVLFTTPPPMSTEPVVEVEAPKRVKDFVNNTDYIVKEIEQLMKKAMMVYLLDEATSKFDRTPEDAIGLIEGASLYINY